jgi:hypothetical protein
MDPKGEGRSAITGTQSKSVWDFLRFKSSHGKPFNNYPHLTLAIEDDKVIVQVTLPNALNREFRNSLVKPGYGAFKSMIAEFVRAADPLLVEGARPFVGVLQRHYKSQRDTNPIRDAHLHFDARTCVPNSTDAVKIQEEWLKAAFEAFSNRRSNIELGIGVEFPYRTHSAIKTPAAIDCVEKAWLSCRPLIQSIGLS